MKTTEANKGLIVASREYRGLRQYLELVPIAKLKPCSGGNGTFDLIALTGGIAQ